MASTKFLYLLPIAILLSSAAAASVGPTGDGAGTPITGSRDITKILGQFPNFSTLKDLLTQTKVADEINSRQSITVLAVPNSAISSVSSLPADVQKKVLSVHVVLDYYDLDKISNLPGSTAQLTTLFQASGQSTGKSGFLNATDVGDSVVKIGSAVPDAGLDSEVVQMLAQQPYNISIIEISQPIIPPGIASSGNATSSNSSTTPSPAPKSAATPPTASPAPKAATPASTPPATSPKASTPAPSSKPATPNDTAPAPAKKAAAPSEAPVVSPSAHVPTTAPISDAPDAGSAGVADKPSSAAGNSVVGFGVALATWVAFSLGAL